MAVAIFLDKSCPILSSTRRGEVGRGADEEEISRDIFMRKPAPTLSLPLRGREIGRKPSIQAFTLIELSVVLVIIGLIVGGVIVGQSLIGAAAVRAQISQTEKFNTAANTFYGKYAYLPGDIPAAPATQFGFAVRGTGEGQGDGNGLIEGCYSNGVAAIGQFQGCGETAMFWVDLTVANLIDGSFTAANSSSPASNITLTATPLMSSYLPQAKLGSNLYIYAYSANNVNYFGLSAAYQQYSAFHSYLGLTVQQAYALDSKIDDGLPQSGRLTALYVNVDTFGTPPTYGWAGTTNAGNAPYTTSTAGSSSSCFDNSSAASGNPGVTGAIQHYSVEMNNGANITCALSFRMQAGD